MVYLEKLKPKHCKFREFIDEEEWLRLTPDKRIEETTKLWQLYLALGGSLDSEPDPQSHFYFKEA